MKPPDTNRLLRIFCGARFGVAGLLLTLGPFIPPELLGGANHGLLRMALVAVVISSGALLLVGALAQPRRIATLLCVLDVVLITAVVAGTGGPRSIFTFLYVLSVIAACVLLSRPASLAIAGVASVLYIGLVYWRTIFPMAVFFEPPAETTAFEVLTMFMNSGTFLVVAIVAGGLAERFHTTREELETHRRDLRDLQAFKDLIFHSVDTGLIALDREHRITAFNRAAEAITGRDAAVVMGEPGGMILGASLPLESIEAAVTSTPGTSQRHETALERPDGTMIPVRLTFSPLCSGDGARVGLIAACEDLSRIRQMEARMRQADRLASLGRMAANIAHEIRNPLASLTGAVEALARPASFEDERERLVRIVLRESDRLNAVISDFLDYARPAPLALERVNVADILDDVLVLLERGSLPPAVKPLRDFPAELPWRVDAHQFRQAIWNLCLNAVEAMPDGGELTVGAAGHRDRLEVWVSDTGDGIEVGEVSQIFEPFFSTKPHGSGLGLALVHRVVSDHAGHVDVRTAPESGTTITLTLPVQHG